MNTAIAWVLKLYRKLSRALPTDFQERHAGEMVQTTEDLVHYTAARRGPRALISVVLRVFGDLFWRIPIEHGAELRQDVRYGLRMLANSPGFTLASVISLGIGIGLTVSTFSQTELIMRPVPQVEDAASLVTIGQPVSYPHFEHLRDQSGLFDSLAAYIAPVPLVVSQDGEARRLWGHIVSPEYFKVLGAKPSRGRLIDDEARPADSIPVAVMSYRLWENRYGEDPSIIGRTISINGRKVTIVGVGVRDFLGASPMLSAADLWLPTSTAAVDRRIQ